MLKQKLDDSLIKSVTGFSQDDCIHSVLRQKKSIGIITPEVKRLDSTIGF